MTQDDIADRAAVSAGILEQYKDFLIARTKYTKEQLYGYIPQLPDNWEELNHEERRNAVNNSIPPSIEEELELERLRESLLSLLINNDDEYSQNYDALERLEIERNAANGKYILDGVAVELPPLMNSHLRIDRGPDGDNDPEYKVRMDRLISIIKMLLDHFGDDGIKVTLRVKTQERFGEGKEEEKRNNIIDFFIKMPDGRSFALVLRSNGETFVKWREDKQSFYVQKKGRKGMNKWHSMDSAIENLRSTIELKHQKSPLLGTSRSDRNRPINKAIVLCGNTKIANTNSPDLWVDFGLAKALRIYKDSLTYVVEQASLIEFLSLPENK